MPNITVFACQQTWQHFEIEKRIPLKFQEIYMSKYGIITRRIIFQGLDVQTIKCDALLLFLSHFCCHMYKSPLFPVHRDMGMRVIKVKL